MREKRRRNNKWLWIVIIIVFVAMAWKGGAEDTQIDETTADMSSDNIETDQAEKEIPEIIMHTESDEEGVEVHFIDVGEGDAILIKSGAHAMMIDAGDDAHESAVQEYLAEQEIAYLDYALVSIPDSQHVGGMDAILENYTVGQVLLPAVDSEIAEFAEIQSVIKQKEMQLVYPVVSEVYRLGAAEFTIIASGGYEGNADNTVAIRLTYGENSFVFCGDATAQIEQDMINDQTLLGADVLKVSRHGSDEASSEAFLKAVSPAYAIISCKEKPDVNVLQRIERNGIATLRTDENGTITAYTDGRNVTWSIEK